MDHQAFAQLLGNYGEFVGAIAVVATLGYLAVQIRQSTRSDYASRMIALQSEFAQVHSQVASNPALAELVALCRSDSLSNLSPVEDEIIESFANANLNTYASIEIAYRESQLQRDIYEVYCEDFRRYLAKYPAIIPRMRAIILADRANDWGIFRAMFEPADE